MILSLFIDKKQTNTLQSLLEQKDRFQANPVRVAEARRTIRSN